MRRKTLQLRYVFLSFHLHLTHRLPLQEIAKLLQQLRGRIARYREVDEWYNNNLDPSFDMVRCLFVIAPSIIGLTAEF